MRAPKARRPQAAPVTVARLTRRLIPSLYLRFALPLRLAFALASGLARDLLALLARLGEADGDRLLAALHRAAASALAAFELALFAALHDAFDVLAGAARISGHSDFSRRRRAAAAVGKTDARRNTRSGTTNALDRFHQRRSRMPVVEDAKPAADRLTGWRRPD